MPGASTLNVAIVPGKVAPDGIYLQAGSIEAVILTRISDELRRNVQASQGLVHLFATSQRHVAVGLAAEKKRWRSDAIGVQKRV